MRTDQVIRNLMTRGFRPLTDVPQRDVERACDRVLERLQEEPEGTLNMPTRSARSGVRPAVSLTGVPGDRNELRWPPTWAAAAAAIAIAAMVGTAMLWHPSVELYRVVEGDVVQGQPIRSSGGAGAVLELADGSRIEMRSYSELSLERAEDGLRIRLNRGGIIVDAVKQRSGHLYVQTKDVMVSVVGTVFLVNADDEGSRVTVIEGEVRVHQGAAEKKLLPGEQVTTSPLMESPSMRETIAWSRKAETLLALLQQSAIVTPAVQGSTGPREAFEVVSVRPTVYLPGGGRGAGGGGLATLRAAGDPCGGANSMFEIDPRRVVVNDMTVHALVAAAYGLDCRIFVGADFLVGGPEWTRSDGFDIQALIPAGTPSYTEQQFFAGSAPHVQRMLQTLLTDRFGLVVRHETREMPVYVLTVATGGPKLGATRTDRWVPGTPRPASFIATWKEGDRACCESSGPLGFYGDKRPMERFARLLGFVLARPVLNRTGLTGEFNYGVSFPWQDLPGLPTLPPGVERPREPGAPPEETRSPATVLEQDLGLKLETARAPVEVLVIERVEKPTEN